MLTANNQYIRNLHTLKLVGRLHVVDGGVENLPYFIKIHNNIAPDYLKDCLNEYLVVNNYNQRNSLQYRVPRCRLSKNIYNILIDLNDMKLYSVLRMLSFICIQPLTPLFPNHFCLSNIFMYTFIIYVTCCHFHIYVYIIIVQSGCTKLIQLVSNLIVHL